MAPVHAAPSTDKTISFSARLKRASGSVVPDGAYNVRFRIYSQAQNGSPLWSETYYDTNGTGEGQDHRVQVRGGYLSVKLGSREPFLDLIDWSQNLYLTMDIGGTTHTATPDAPSVWDGEMSPRIQLTAVPYAISAGSIGGKTANDFAHLGQGVQVDHSNASSLFINKLGGGNLLQLQANGADIFTLNKNGAITLGAGADRSIAVGASSGGIGHNLSITAGAGTSGGTLALQGGAATGLDGNGGDVVIDAGAGNGNGLGGTLALGTSNASAITIGGAGTTTTVGGNLAVGDIDTSDGGTLNLGGTNASDISLGADTTINGEATVRSQDNSASALQVQNSAGSTVLNVATDGGTTLTLGSGSGIAGSLGLSGGGEYTGTLNTSGLTDDRTYTLPDESGTICIAGSANCGFIQGNPESAQDANIWMTGGATFGDSVQVQTTENKDGALQVQNANGDDILSVSTATNQIAIGTIDENATLLVLDTKTSEGDPSGPNGSMYYNSFAKKFRCREDDKWKDCVTPLPVSKLVGTDFATDDADAVDVNDLAFDLAPNTKYSYRFVLMHEAGLDTTGIGFGVTTPTGPTMSNWCVNTTTTIATPTPGHWGSYCGVGDASATTDGQAGLGTSFTSTMEGYIETDEEGGTLKLRVRSQHNGETVTIKEKSFGVLQIVQ